MKQFRAGEGLCGADHSLCSLRAVRTVSVRVNEEEEQPKGEPP